MTTSGMTINQFETRAASKGGPGAGVRMRVRALAGQMEAWYERGRLRRELEALPDSLLKDIGASPEEIYRESRKPFWKA